MASVLRQSVTLENELKSAAAGIHFGEAEADLQPEIRPLPDELAQPAVSSRRLKHNGLLWSAALHALMLLILAAAAGVGSRSDVVPEFEAIRATLSDRDAIDDDALVPPGAEIILQQSSGPAASNTVLPSSITEITMDEAEVRFAPVEFAPAIGEHGEQERGIGTGGTEGLRYQKPNGGQAVTRGSFTVWTEPPDPFPNQPYYIVIQLRVPENLTVYPKSDLKVEVVGSDTFHLKLPDPRRGFRLLGTLPVADGKTQLVIPIPGAPSLVRDLIRIESREILHEKQTLRIEF
jgi:hypothetical protein